MKCTSLEGVRACGFEMPDINQEIDKVVSKINESPERIEAFRQRVLFGEHIHLFLNRKMQIDRFTSEWDIRFPSGSLSISYNS